MRGRGPRPGRLLRDGHRRNRSLIPLTFIPDRPAVGPDDLDRHRPPGIRLEIAVRRGGFRVEVDLGERGEVAEEGRLRDGLEGPVRGVESPGPLGHGDRPRATLLVPDGDQAPAGPRDHLVTSLFVDGGLLRVALLGEAGIVLQMGGCPRMRSRSRSPAPAGRSPSRWLDRGRRFPTSGLMSKATGSNAGISTATFSVALEVRQPLTRLEEQPISRRPGQAVEPVTPLVHRSVASIPSAGIKLRCRGRPP